MSDATRESAARNSDLDDVHDRPTATELVTAVREWLDSVAAGEADANRFHTRVAANMLAIVERQARLGDELAARHRERFDALGVSDQADLAAKIRAGAFDETIDETIDADGVGGSGISIADVRAAVLANVCDKLRVANPTYLERTDMTDL